MLSVTKSALNKLVQISKTHKVNQLLFHVSGGGCNGLKYNIEPFKESPKKNRRNCSNYRFIEYSCR